ncbi:MAG: RDD family protein [Paludibacter sp.]|nr:RDD family protein [Paludibacter sp.]
MIDLSTSCLKCQNIQKSADKRLVCGITQRHVNFEDSCDLFEVNAALQQKLENEVTNNVKFNYVSKNVRISNYAIDLLALLILEVIFGIFIIFIAGKDSSLYSFLFVDSIGRIFFVFFLNLFYYTIFEATTGKTIGKYFTKSKVINLHGEKPEVLRVLLRSICRFIPLDQISFLFDEESGWHDTISKTMVIKE